ncbi:MAG: amino acid adenylation domain-containing protein [Opitutaceae bacterium]
MSQPVLTDPACAGWRGVSHQLPLPPIHGAGWSEDENLKRHLLATLALFVSRYRGSESVKFALLEDGAGNPAGVDASRSVRVDDRLPVKAFLESVGNQFGDPAGPDGAESSVSDGVGELDWLIGLRLSDGVPDMGFGPTEELGRQCALVVSVYREDNRVHLNVRIRDGVLDDWMIPAIPHHLERLWNQLSAGGEGRVCDFSILTDEEYRRTVLEWNDTGVEEPMGTPIPDVFEDNMARFGESVAVIDGDRTLNYRELRSRANRLARHLKTLGAGLDVPVAVFLERSIELVVGMVGLQRAGSAYMPLDPSYPADRIRYQVEDSGVPIIITRSGLVDRLPKGTARLVLLDEDADSIAAQSDEALAPGFAVGHVANVFYTSGSTGKPKGVLMRHSRLTPVGDPKKSPKRVDPGQGMLLKSPVGFTLILLEVNGAINAGGRLVVIPDGKEKDPSYMIRMIREHEVASAGLVPSMLDLLLDDPEISQCVSLKTIHTVGESLPIEVQERFFRKLPEAKLIVYYGCTEAPAATTRVVTAQDDFGRRIVIGKPAGGKRIYILDRNRVPLPIGVSGEIYIGGTLSKGYLNRDELTSERFQDDPFSPHPNSRVYRTGDLGRWLPDGNLEILGRTDFQVQVRGVRIELGEIEDVLRSHESVRDAIVHPDQKGGQVRLFAYVTPKNASPVPIGELREWIRERLPEYMMPAAIIEMPAFPLNAAGKIDRLALPKPEKVERSADAVYLGPRTPTEAKLCRMWAELLDIDRVGIEDDFLDLGGDSFLAVRLLSQVHEEFGRRLELPALFSDPRILSLAAILDGKQKATDLKWLVPTRFFDDSPPTHTFEGSFVFAYVTTRMMEGLKLKFPVYSISIDWKYSNMDYSEGVEELAAHHVEELRKIDPVGPYRFAGYSFGGLVAFEMARQVVALGGEVKFVVLLDPTPPYGSEGTSDAAFLEGERVQTRKSGDAGVSTKLKAVPPHARLAWLWARRRGVLRRIQRVSTALVQSLVVRGLWPGKRIPKALQKDWATLYKLAIWHRYKPGPYQGDVTVFTTEGRDQAARRSWSRVVTGKLTCESLQARTHGDVLKQPASLARLSEVFSGKIEEGS